MSIDQKHHRRSIRLREYDYASEGAYFVTICVKERKCIFGGIRNGVMCLNRYGQMVYQAWLETKTIRPNIILDEFVVMPNHVHGILFIDQDTNRRGVLHTPAMFRSPSQTIGSIIRGLKSSITSKMNEAGYADFEWQRNYYEYVVRDENALNRIREYIRFNPMNWEKDDLFMS